VRVIGDEGGSVRRRFVAAKRHIMTDNGDYTPCQFFEDAGILVAAALGCAVIVNLIAAAVGMPS